MHETFMCFCVCVGSTSKIKWSEKLGNRESSIIDFLLGIDSYQIELAELK